MVSGLWLRSIDVTLLLKNNLSESKVVSIKANQSEVSIVQALIQPIKGKHGDLELLTDLVKDYDLLVL